MDNNILKACNSTLQNGNYIITGLLGQGGFGITYEAEQVSLGRKVAIKEFFIKEYCERDCHTRMLVSSYGRRELIKFFRRKFLKEARLIATLDNPHVVKVYDVFEENDTAYYAMEYLPGGSLKDKVFKEGPLLLEANVYIKQICSALSYIHSKNILHLDVNPSNILINNSGTVVITDFADSKHYDNTWDMTTKHTPLGINKYYSPIEMLAQGTVNFNPSTDIYSLGATLYFLVTGVTPPAALQVIESLVDGNDIIAGLLSEKGVSDNIISVITRAMQPRQKDRPQSIAEFLSILDS